MPALIPRSLSAQLLAGCIWLYFSTFVSVGWGSELPGYEATYRVEYKGIYAGNALFALHFDAERQRYVFESRTQARGLAKLIRRHPAVERSEFLVRDGKIVPLQYAFDDGTRKGKRSNRIVFDWDRGVAMSTYKGITAEVPVKPGTLDRMTMQTAVMRDMGLPAGPAGYVLVDGNELKRYRYELVGTTNTDSALGSLLTKQYRQIREGGSSRQLQIWVAPSLNYMPVRMEQQRQGKTETVFTLQDLTFHP
jgi:hypothetical protein